MKNLAEGFKQNKQPITTESEKDNLLFKSKSKVNQLIIINENDSDLDTTEQVISQQELRINSFSYLLPSQASNTNILPSTTSNQEFNNKVLSSRTHLDGKKNEALFNLKHNLTEENITTATPLPILPSFSREKENEFQLKILPEVSKWKFWMSALLIEKYRDINSDVFAKKTIVNEVKLINYKDEIICILEDIAGVKSIFNELYARIDAIQKPPSFFSFYLSLSGKKWLSDEVKKLSKWFNRLFANYPSFRENLENTASLNSKIQELRTQQRKKLHNIVLSLQHIGSRHLLDILRELDAFLWSLVCSYDRRRYESLEKLESAQKNYYEMSETNTVFNLFNLDLTKVKNTIKSLFEQKLEAEINNQVCRLIGETREQITLYTISANQSDIFLANLQSSFFEKSLGTPFFASLIEKYLDEIDVYNLLEKLEADVGHPLSRWSQFNLEETQFLEQHILKIIQSYCEILYEKCCQKLSENKEIINPESELISDSQNK